MWAKLKKMKNKPKKQFCDGELVFLLPSCNNACKYGRHPRHLSKQAQAQPPAAQQSSIDRAHSRGLRPRGAGASMASTTKTRASARASADRTVPLLRGDHDEFVRLPRSPRRCDESGLWLLRRPRP
ncbi:hypothetical protein BS78_10G178300 [Paspalum vaginatum]|nr:hypothetical protein BS78_10G178300 [Paspalum vaginatum]